MAAAPPEGVPRPARRRRLSRPVVFGQGLAWAQEQQRQRAIATVASLPLLGRLPADLQRSVFALTGPNTIQDFRLVSKAAEQSLHDVLDSRVRFYLQQLRLAKQPSEHHRRAWLAILHPANGQGVGFFDLGDWSSTPPGAPSGPSVYVVYYGKSLEAVLHNVLNEMTSWGRRSAHPVPDYARIASIELPSYHEEAAIAVLAGQLRMLPGERATGHYPSWYGEPKLLEAAEKTPGRNMHQRWFNAPELIAEFHRNALMTPSTYEQQFFIMATDPVTGATIDFRALLPDSWTVRNNVVEKYALERVLKISDYPDRAAWWTGPLLMTTTEKEQRDAERKAFGVHGRIPYV